MVTNSHQNTQFIKNVPVIAIFVRDVSGVGVEGNDCRIFEPQIAYFN